MKANPLAWSFRALYAFAALCCVALLAYALYVQYQMLLDPCPLCILQRLAFVGILAVLLVGLVHNPGTTGRRVYGVLALVPALAGIGIAGRHVWLQSLPPDQVPACGPGLEYMLEAFPLSKAMSMVFTGSGECAKRAGQVVGRSMPGGTLAWFVALASLIGYASFRPRA